MASGSFRFDRFRLDPHDRRLTRDGAPVELNARYLDALALLVREAGRLVSKDRFLDEVWRGVPVTDEALTQCIKTLRRQLGDGAGRPRFIETVPKHGYRFIASVTAADEGEPAASEPAKIAAAAGAKAGTRPPMLQLGRAGTIGGAVAGLVGGLVYGFAGASQPLEPGMGAASVLLVMICLCVAVATIGGAGVGFGIAAGRAWIKAPWGVVVGGAAGGLIVGAIVKLLGIDAFNLLLGQAPVDITGAPEGALIGGSVGLGAWLGVSAGEARLRRSMILAALIGGTAGAAIPSLGGRLMAGSLDLLADVFPASRLRLDPIGSLFGESGLGPVSQAVTGALEGALFGACVVGAIIMARRGGIGRG